MYGRFFFTYYIRQQTILADVTVGCQSSGRRVLQSVIFLLQPPNPALAGPPAPASRGRLCCRAGLTAPTTPTAGQAIPLLTHIPPLMWPCRLWVFPFLGLAVVHRAGVLGTAWSMLSTNDNIGRGMYMERLTIGTHMVHGRTQASTYLLITPKRMNTPADSSHPPAISSHARKCLLITHKK